MRNPLLLSWEGRPAALHDFDQWSTDYRPFPAPEVLQLDRLSRRAAPPGIE
jgi:hypothetical protein